MLNDSSRRTVPAESSTARKSRNTRIIAFADDDGSQGHPDDDAYLVKGVIHRRSIGTLVGPSGVGKSTMVLDLAYALATGADRYEGRRLKRAPVLYLGYEGLAGLRNRIAAMRREYGDPGGYFARMWVAPLLTKGSDGAKGLELVIAAAKDLERECGEPVGLIVIDTKSRATAGDDEDKAADVSAFVEKRVAEIVRATGAAVLTVHHTGKDEGRGARGSSALYAADDFHICIDGDRRVTIDKARDGTGGAWFSYDLDAIELRMDSDGDPVTAPILRRRSAEPKRATRRLPQQAVRADNVLDELYLDDAAVSVSEAETSLTGLKGAVRKAVPMGAFREACCRVQLSDTGKPPAERKALNRALDALQSAGRIGKNEAYVWRIDQPTVRDML